MDREGYMDYIHEHIRNVQKVFNKVRNTLEYVMPSDSFEKLENLIRNHDISKLSDDEFYGYCQWFFSDGEIRNRDDFDIAWNHHQKSNPHHWQYWIMWKSDGSIALDMPLIYVIEMLCDWAAMSMKFGNDIVEWYNKEKHSMFLSEKTTLRIEEHINLFKLE